MLPCLIFEDEHLLVVNKPAGLNTHAPSPYAGEGLYDWLRNREVRWGTLAIIHRLDKETSGVIVFSKTPLANRSLTAQFSTRRVRKRYLLLTDRPVGWKELVVRSALARSGERYVGRPLAGAGAPAETQFRKATAPKAEDAIAPACQMIEAVPLTGRTHQIRVHAAENGFPVLGDTLYNGTAAPRVYLHAVELRLRHSSTGEEMTFRAQIALAGQYHPQVVAGSGLWRTDPLPCLALRHALIDPGETNAYRVIHGASDGQPGFYVERLGDFLLSQSEQPLTEKQSEQLQLLAKAFPARGAYHKLLTRQVGRAIRGKVSPQHVLGDVAPALFTIRENGLQFEVSFDEGYSAGLFLDQRDNRRRILTRLITPGFAMPPLSLGDGQREVLNTFAYTCGFSVCAAKAGARTTSIDLSNHYLEWGKRNFELNQLVPGQHEFLHGDVLDWLRRLAKKNRRFDLVLLDPPTFSQSKASGVFRAEKDYGRLLSAALPLVRAGGILFASTNAANWPPEEFLATVEHAIGAAGRTILQRHFFPQPPDFPISKAEPAYLKTVWLRLE
ncbi:MAG TPA: pseudouridine synthase [Candidatus Paceibacterota bacterium]|nr:pseudouridine synthase [Verrucomicrobiota bacterium]HSA11268.1 pseudouridine synthase [Candidatus Paceibacterota bacterium]